MRIGTRVEGRRLPIDTNLLTKMESVKGQIYEVVVKLDKPIDDSKAYELANRLQSWLLKHNGEMLYFESFGDTVVMDIRGSPFAWSSFIANLSDILAFLGFAIVSISIMLIIVKEPLLAFATLIGTLMLIAGLISKLSKLRRRE